MIKMTPYEIKVSRLRLEGFSFAAIALRLNTKKKHIENSMFLLYKRLGVHNVAQLRWKMEELGISFAKK